MTILERTQKRAALRERRVRAKVRGTAERPRLTVFRSNKNTYIQVIDDASGKTIAAANDIMLAKQSKKALTGTKSDKAVAIAEAVVEQLKKQKVTQLCFDRGSYRYHGRLQKIAEAVRAAGIKV